MSDTPTNNYATFNPLNTTAVASSDATLTTETLMLTQVTTSANNYSSYLTHGITSGKYYFEVTCTSSTTSASLVGFVGDNNLEAKRNATASAVPGLQGTYGRGVDGGGTLYNGSGSSDGSYMAAWSQNDVIMVAIDADNGKFWLGANGNWANGSGSTNQSGLIAAAEISLSSSTTPYLFGVGDSSGSVAASFTLNAGQRAFSHTPPTGYSALNTSNLPAPDIADGSDYFKTVLYTGTGATQSITGVGFQPDWTWLKGRSTAYNHYLYDVLRGTGKALQTNQTNTEETRTGLTSFDSDGFTLGSQAGDNNLNTTYVAWNWLAANGTETLDAGSITSTVSANPTAGFSIVSYTGGGAAATVGHGLGVAPKMIIVKRRDSAGYSWNVYHESTGNTGALYLELTNAFATDSTRWNNTSPTSTVFSIGSGAAVSGSGGTFIAYCFAEVEGFSKIGSYRGTNTSEGPFIYCGFTPKWVLIKNTGQTWGWVMHDSVREPYNLADDYLLANASDSEVTGDVSRAVDFLSNGFKVRGDSSFHNSSSYDMIFAAFASNPFGGDGVSPATAR